MTKRWMLSAAPLAGLALAGTAVAQPQVNPTPPSQENAGASPATSTQRLQSPSAAAGPAAPSGPAASSSTPTGVLAANPATLSEVVVTAQRRSENLQKAAIAVDVVGGRDLVKNNITTPNDLGFLVPALTPSPGGFFLRGVGNFTVDAYADPAIAFNYDGVYIGRISDTQGYFYDLQRVEVLKGPQGTLYGRNATGGAINVIPEVPKLNSYSGYLNAGGGNYGFYDVEGAVNLPVDDKTAVRLSGNTVGHDGYLSDGTSDERLTAGRIQILRQFTPDLTIRVAADYEALSGAGTSGSYAGRYQFNGKNFTFIGSDLPRSEGLFDASAQTFHNSAAAGPAGRNLQSIPDYPYQNEHFYGVESEINYNTPIGRLIVEPEYRHSTPDTRATTLPFTADDTETDEQYGLEARFLGNRVGILDYSIGAQYFHESNVGRYVINQQDLYIYQNYDQTTRSWAVFGIVTAHITDRLRLVGGLRYTDDSRMMNQTSTTLQIICLTAPVAPCPGVPLFSNAPSLGQQTVPFPPFGVPVVPIPGSGVPGAIDVRRDIDSDISLDNHRTTYRAAVEFDITSRSLAYGSVETGFRSGGFNQAAGFLTYKPEYITAYTIGSKNRFFENRLQLNIEGFVWNYQDQQLNHLGIDADGVQSLFTQNIGRSIEKGAEVEARYLLTPDTVLSTDLQYLDAHYDEFKFDQPTTAGPILSGCPISVVSATAAVVNCSGKPVYNSPKYTLNLGVEQTFHLPQYNVVLSGDTQFRTSRYVGFEYLAQELAPPVWQTNAELTLTPVNGPWSLQLFVHNLEDARYTQNDNLGSIGNLLVNITSPPRTFGGRVSLKF